MSQRIMTITDLRQLLTKLSEEIDGGFEIWLSCDEEGNEFLPMFENPELCLAIDKQAKRIIFFPSHR
jgi:hypothetical protein